jgi:hypothetical protein
MSYDPGREFAGPYLQDSGMHRQSPGYKEQSQGDCIDLGRLRPPLSFALFFERLATGKLVKTQQDNCVTASPNGTYFAAIRRLG